MIRLDDMDEEVIIASIFNVMRILKPLHLQDTFYENYLGMYQRYKPFFDSYMLMWNIGFKMAPRRILEIGTRTGTSICQLLSSYMSHAQIEKIVLVDPFPDGFSSPQVVFKNMQWLNLPVDKRVSMIVAKSEEFIPTLAGEKFDYILVDGDHGKEAARRDLDNVVPLIEDGGIIVFDDISTSPGECALIDVWQDWARANRNKFDFSTRMEGKGVGWAIKRYTDEPVTELVQTFPMMRRLGDEYGM